MPLQPPTRPHTANPHITLNPSLFPRSVTPITTQNTRHKSSNSTSMSSPSRRESEWDDAWDSSSDQEDDTTLSSRPGVAIPIRTVSDRPTGSSSGEVVGGGIAIQGGDSNNSTGTTGGGGGGTPSSWASSFHHVSIPSAGTPIQSGSGTGSSGQGQGHRPSLSTSKTYTEGGIAPPPGTAHIVGNGSPTHGKRDSESTSASRTLPPGGAWELIETVEIQEAVDGSEEQPVKAGVESIRDDLEDILKDPLQLLSTLSLSTPSTPTPNLPHPNPSSQFPFLTSPPLHKTPTTPGSARSLSGISNLTGMLSPETLPSGSGSTSTSTGTTPKSYKRDFGRQRSVRTERRREKFAKVLKGRLEDGGGVENAELRRLAWSGIPYEVRPIAWQLLLNYLPLPAQPRLSTLSRKRKEYSSLVDQYFGRGLGALDQQIWHQIEIDVPRTRPGILLWSCVTAQRALERILYVWAIRHPASGYVQGINDLVTPFFQVFLSAYIDTDPELFDVSLLPTEALAAIEADTFWCLSKLLDGIQDNYISHQPGIQRLVKRMSELVKRIDAPLAAHFEDQGVEFMQFAFRWMNCLLMREMNVKCTIRMWDTYLAEGTDAFSQFHLYVCSALLVKYSHQLQDMDFQEMIMFLQRLPTHGWTDHDVELLLSEAYVLKTVWQGAENHFVGSGNGEREGGGSGFHMLGR